MTDNTNNDRTERTAEPGDGPATGGPSAPGPPEDGSPGTPSSASEPDADATGPRPDESDTPAGEDPLLQSVTPDELPDPTESMRLAVDAQGGNKQALDDLFKRYQPRLRRIVSIRLSAKLRRCVESLDIVQQTYVSAFRKIGDLELRGTASILNWLARIAENHMLDTHRHFYAEKRNKDREVHLDGSSRHDGGSGHDRVFIADAPRPDDIAAQRELERIVDESVGELPDDYREVIMLRTYCGGSWDYVCRELGHVSSEASRQLHRRARIRLGRIVRARIANDQGSK